MGKPLVLASNLTGLRWCFIQQLIQATSIFSTIDPKGFPITDNVVALTTQRCRNNRRRATLLLADRRLGPGARHGRAKPPDTAVRAAGFGRPVTYNSIIDPKGFPITNSAVLYHWPTGGWVRTAGARRGLGARACRPGGRYARRSAPLLRLTRSSMALRTARRGRLARLCPRPTYWEERKTVTVENAHETFSPRLGLTTLTMVLPG